jgi:hypothetical protein
VQLVPKVLKVLRAILAQSASKDRRESPVRQVQWGQPDQWDQREPTVL